MKTRDAGMRVLLAVPWYFPESIGGTEVFVHSLAQHLGEGGVDVAVAVPSRGPRAATFVHDGVQVFQFPAGCEAGEISLDRSEPAGWCDLLQTFAPTVVDLHAVTSGLELAHLKAAHRRGVRTVTTLHLPGTVCARGTFMRFGTTPCPGNLARQPCTACRLEADGVPPPIGRLLALIPDRIATNVGASALPHAFRRAVTAGLKDRVRLEWLHQIAQYADRIVAPSKWLVDVLVGNGLSQPQIVLCRQGVTLAQPTKRTERRPEQALRVGFVGRYDPVKGLRVLIDAARRIPAAVRLEVHVWGIARSSDERRYRETMVARASGNSLVTFHDETAHAATIYEQIDVLAVPSEGFETGPLVVLEAQAAGLPIVGSNIGGIAERVIDGVNGILVPVGDPVELAGALTSLANDRALLEALQPCDPPRTMADVATETMLTYAAITRGERSMPVVAVNSDGAPARPTSVHA